MQNGEWQTTIGTGLKGNTLEYFTLKLKNIGVLMLKATTMSVIAWMKRSL